jgi:hypothetical protein
LLAISSGSFQAALFAAFFVYNTVVLAARGRSSKILQLWIEAEKAMRKLERAGWELAILD